MFEISSEDDLGDAETGSDEFEDCLRGYLYHPGVK